MFVKSDLVQKFNWPEMSPREVELSSRKAETSTSIERAEKLIAKLFERNQYVENW